MKIRNNPRRIQVLKKDEFILPRWVWDLGWGKVLTSQLFIYFAIVCMVATQDLEGEEMWAAIEDVASKQRWDNPDKRQRAAAKELQEQYGRPVPSKLDVRGNVDFLIATGIVVREMRNGKEILDVTENPPKPASGR